MRYYSSTAEAKTLAATLSNTATTMQLNSVTTLPSSYPYTLVIDPDKSNEEIVLVTGYSAGLLTIARGSTVVNGVIAGDGTLAQEHANGAVVKHMVTSRDLQEPQTHIAASSGVHGVTGTLVGTDSNQTLTNKTISSASNTITVAQSNVVGLTDALAAKAPLASPAFTGTPSLPSGTTATTQTAGTNNTTLATTAFVKTAGDAKLNEPAANGIIVRTASGTTQARSLVAGTGVTITNADGVSGNITIAASATGTGLADPGANGMLARTALNTTTARTITQGTGITVQNGNGSSGNPTVAIDTTVLSLIKAYSDSSTQTNPKIFYTSGTTTAYSGEKATASVSFGSLFTNTPAIVAICTNSVSLVPSISGGSNTGCTVNLQHKDSTNLTQNYNYSLIAIGV